MSEFNHSRDHGLTRRPAHRDRAAMNGAQLLKAHFDSSGLMSGPPAVVSQFSKRRRLIGAVCAMPLKTLDLRIIGEKGGNMSRCFGLVLLLCALSSGSVHAMTSLNISVVTKSIVFFFASDPAGNVIKDKLVATGFLVLVPNRGGENTYPLLVTARHVVDPVWAGCEVSNPTRLYIRVNNMHFDRNSNSPGVSYLPVDLTANGSATWLKSDDESVDVAVLKAPRELLSGDYDIKFLNFRNFGKPDEIAKIGIGSQTTSAGLVPGLEGTRRNNPIFHFGRVASIPDETIGFKCRPDSQPRPLRVWWLATTLVPGTSGSPIFFDPLFPPGADVTAGEPRGMIIGLQSLALNGADLAGMTPAKYIMEVISQSVGTDADLNLGVPPR
jgi:hypothetical protein